MTPEQVARVFAGIDAKRNVTAIFVPNRSTRRGG
jgi:hypothetical protein